MSDDQFIKLFNYMSQQFKELRAELAEKADRAQLDTLIGAVDSLSGQIGNAVTDNAARDIQLDRHEQAITQLAGHAGVQLQYE